VEALTKGVNLPRFLESTNAPGFYKRDIAQKAIQGYDFHQGDASDDGSIGL